MQQLVNTFNDAADRYNLARLEYSFACVAMAPPPALRLPPDEQAWTDDQRPVTTAVQAVRDYFEAVADGAIVAPTLAPAYERMRVASLLLTRRFFQVSLTQLGIPCEGIIEAVDE